MNTRFLKELLPLTAQVVRQCASEHGVLENKRPGLFTYEILVEKHDIDLLEGIYATAITNYSVNFLDGLPMNSVDIDARITTNSLTN